MTQAAAKPTRIPADGAPVVLTQGLTKIFRDFWMRPRVRAVDNLDLEIRPREVFGLLGPNGSGKSTTIKILLGLLHKTSGRVAVFGKPPEDVAVKKRIGVLPEESYLYPFLNARETLDFYGKLFELDYRARKRRTDELLDMVGLTAVQHRQVKEYSKGMQRRIGIAQALINDPEFLILDEPTSGLDPIGSRQIKDLIIELGRRGKTVLLSSHQLSDVEDCVHRLAILYGGKKRAEGTVDDLLTAGAHMTIQTPDLDDETVSEIDRLIQARTGHAIERVGRTRQRLEDLFLNIVETARAERVETSGATHGGETAAFLRGEEAQGEALIEQLTSDRQEPEPEPEKPEAPAAPTGPDESVIDTLVSSEEPEPARPEKQPEEDGPAEVDSDLIRSLTSEKRDEEPNRDGGSAP